MDRRDLLLATGAAFATASLGAQGAETHEHHHEHSDSALVHSAMHCIETGNICLAHSYDRLADGDKSMAACARSITQLIAVCNGLAVLAAQQSPLLAQYAAVTAQVCKACEDECSKHGEHPPCKACADACKACAAECAKVSG
ncbi:MAG: Csp1 family four helix bundle copper storage protein [Pseudomonadota bacterium]|jgi:hypothetical protein